MALLLIIFGLIAWIDMPSMIKKKQWRDVAAFGVIFALTLTISVLNQLGTPIPSTVLTMDDLMHSIGINY